MKWDESRSKFYFSLVVLRCFRENPRLAVPNRLLNDKRNIDPMILYSCTHAASELPVMLDLVIVSKSNFWTFRRRSSSPAKTIQISLLLGRRKEELERPVLERTPKSALSTRELEILQKKQFSSQIFWDFVCFSQRWFLGIPCVSSPGVDMLSSVQRVLSPGDCFLQLGLMRIHRGAAGQVSVFRGFRVDASAGRIQA